MKIINVSSDDLENFQIGGNFNRIHDLCSQIIKNLPEELKLEVKYRKIKLDYFTDDIDVPKFTIPYCFELSDFSHDLRNYFKEYIIFVEW